METTNQTVQQTKRWTLILALLSLVWTSVSCNRQSAQESGEPGEKRLPATNTPAEIAQPLRQPAPTEPFPLPQVSTAATNRSSTHANVSSPPAATATSAVALPAPAVEPPKQPSRTVTPTPVKTVKRLDLADAPRWFVTATYLNVRQGPTTDQPVIAELKQGTPVAQLADHDEPRQGKWYLVKTVGTNLGVEGWVAAQYLAPSKRLTEGSFSGLHYEPVPKRDYPQNPKRNVRALYVPLNAFSSSARFDEILTLVRQTRINGLVIDFKDDIGELLTHSLVAEQFNPLANQKSRNHRAPGKLKQLRDLNVYLIARIVTFKDPIYAQSHPQRTILNRSTGRPYQSRDKLTWMSPFDPTFQSYNIGLAAEAAKMGFNEVQFDYVRFPDVPRSANLDYRPNSSLTKAEVIQRFLLDARKKLEPLQVYTAADVFGLVCTTKDDMRIGQYWEAISNAVDYICPMMYPSHYANGSYGLSIPDQHPYELIDRGVIDGIKRNGNLVTPARIRPWLQAFTATWVKGHRSYGPAEVKAQIKALEDNGVHSYLMWHPAARYNPSGYR